MNTEIKIVVDTQTGNVVRGKESLEEATGRYKICDPFTKHTDIRTRSALLAQAALLAAGFKATTHGGWLK